MRKELETHKAKLATCVLYSWKNAKNEEIGRFGPTFLRPDDDSDCPVYAESMYELLLVEAFLFIAEIAQFDRSNMTETGCYYSETLPEVLPCKRSRTESNSEGAIKRMVAMEEMEMRMNLLQAQAKKRRLLYRFLKDPKINCPDVELPAQRARHEASIKN